MSKDGAAQRSESLVWLDSSQVRGCDACVTVCQPRPTVRIASSATEPEGADWQVLRQVSVLREWARLTTVGLRNTITVEHSM